MHAKSRYTGSRCPESLDLFVNGYIRFVDSRSLPFELFQIAWSIFPRSNIREWKELNCPVDLNEKRIKYVKTIMSRKRTDDFLERSLLFGKNAFK